MKETILRNNVFIMTRTRAKPLVTLDGDKIIMEDLFLTDVKYTKYLVPYIKCVDFWFKIKDFIKAK